ncbi:SRPBCC family protein [Actinotalea sp. M2MS4P-6]|uniref:SRPBCC family protein n=1 Tax=Actinotalea sp. M2MS4P-6 TaxID=2983762 RepID=UPI0021E3871A|nr:SRPBCC family protein [Actinotalea sp. M2MS4P-6]MCV2395103.1 SRPBCC family protein [Actinotalea sp. M2MS4P-6]
MPAARTVLLPIPAEQAFALLTDIRRHADWVPLTRIDVLGPTDDDGRLVPGGEFVATTGPLARSGAPGLADRMRLTELRPPRTDARASGTARYTKVGPVLTGWAVLSVHPLGVACSEVTWTERIGVRRIPAAVTDALGTLPTTGMLRTVLGRVAREVAAAPHPG